MNREGESPAIFLSIAAMRLAGSSPSVSDTIRTFSGRYDRLSSARMPRNFPVTVPRHCRVTTLTPFRDLLISTGIAALSSSPSTTNPIVGIRSHLRPRSTIGPQARLFPRKKLFQTLLRRYTCCLRRPLFFSEHDQIIDTQFVDEKR